MKVISLAILLSLGLSSCSSGEFISDKDIEGTWKLESAMRDGKATPALEGVYFEFEEKEFETNFPVPGLGNQYSVGDKKIMLEGTTPLEMYINNLENNQMVLELSLRGSNFRLLLNKETESSN